MARADDRRRCTDSAGRCCRSALRLDCALAKREVIVFQASGQEIVNLYAAILTPWNVLRSYQTC